MRKNIGILGLGIFGSSLAQTLAEHDYDVIAVDKNEEHVNELSPYITKGVVGNITDRELLETIGIGDCNTVIISTGTVLEASVLAVMHCKKLGIPHIIAKAKNTMYKEVLEEIGAHEVILPERESGVHLAKKLMRNTIDDIVPLGEFTSLVEFHAPEKWVGKTLIELDLRNRYNLNIIGLRETEDAPFKIAISPDTTIQEGWIFFGITDSNKFEEMDYLQESID